MLIKEGEVKKTFGISTTTLHRWDNDPSMNFPPPIYLRGRKYRDPEQVEAWCKRKIADEEATRKTMLARKQQAIAKARYVGLWVVDRPVSEELNRRLNYFIGSDKSGWDLTQVLRVPGTFNYKYTSVPKVKILWRDGPNYEVDEIERRVPKETRSSSSSIGSATLIKKYEHRLPHWCRRALTTDNPIEGKRSEMIYKIGQTLVEKKVPQDDALVMLKGSPWNKYRHRGDEDERLRAIGKSNGRSRWAGVSLPRLKRHLGHE